MDFWNELNKEQKEAVLHVDGPLLILAGAGSGKTRVLTYRVAYLIREKNVHPSSILAITFTNKAAREMKERIGKLVGGISESIWISTFHSACVKILRRDIDKIGYDRNFVIFDSADQQTVIKDCLKELDLNDKNFPPRQALEMIGRAKDELIESEAYARMYGSDFRLGKIAKIYELYQKKLRQYNALDFDDIIMVTIKLFLKNPPVLEYYHRKFKYILVDEYQDTNTAQYSLISLLAQQSKNLCVVGDDDQCLLEGQKINTLNTLLPIEQIKENQSVLCAAGWGEIMVGKVDKIVKKKYKGPIVKIRTASGREIKATPNHIGFAKINTHKGVYYVYLMYKRGLGYRIGQTQGVRSRKGEIVNGLFARLNQEHGDKMWILHICTDREEATYYEQLYSTKYGVPTTLFHGIGREITLSQFYINKIFNEINTEKAAVKLMEDLMLFEEFPHHFCNAVIRGQSVRRIINITAFGGKKTGNEAGWHSHRICINTSGDELKAKLKCASFPIRNGNRNTWRIETERKEYDEADEYASRISQQDENIEIVKKARLTQNLSFMYMPVAHMKPTMSVAVLENGQIVEDIIVEVKFDQYDGNVYDLSISHFRQYITQGIVVHNSIYGWRGANIRNILDFEKEFKNCKVVKLEQNYRSTRNILFAANNVIKNNFGRKSKSLWTDNPEGGKIRYYQADNEHEEAMFVANEIKRLNTFEGKMYKDFAALYRINAQSRVFEDIFIREGIPYKIIGGLRFYDRKEIKDIIAYLRVIQNPSDNISLKRIINVPKRGIGNATLETAEEIANRKGCSIFSIISSAPDIQELQRALSKLENFISIMSRFRVLKNTMKVSGLIEEVIEQSGILKELKGENTVEAGTRIENIRELISVALEFEKQSEEQGLEEQGSAEQGLEEFLAQVSLVSDIDNLEEEEDHVVLMTLHSAKGLEFPVVFMTGMEDGVFPGHRSITEENGLEEERRLCYVGITRAREKLYMTNAYSRTLFGSTSHNTSSRFIDEIPDGLIDDPARGRNEYLDSRFTGVMNLKERIDPYMSFSPGDKVRHKKFGIGVITSIEEDNDDFKLEIQFENAGMKRLMAAYANLSKLE